MQPRPPSARTPGYAAGRSVNYIGTYKRAGVDAEGTLRLFWWANNDGLKGEPISGSGDRDMQAGMWLERDLTFTSSAANLSAASRGTPPPVSVLTEGAWPSGATDRSMAHPGDAWLHDAALTLPGFHLVNLRHLRTRTGRDTKSRHIRARLEFRAVLEPAAS